jgi:hypothetical protein
MTQKELGARSARLRQQRAQIRRGLADGSLNVVDVLAERPEAIADLNVYEVLRMVRRVGRSTLADMGRRAIADGVNLMVLVRSASTRTVGWIDTYFAPPERSLRPLITHCLRGHAFDEENTRWKSNGARSCKECERIRQRDLRARRAA